MHIFIVWKFKTIIVFIFLLEIIKTLTENHIY